MRLRQVATAQREPSAKITVETVVKAPQDDWHTTESAVDLREGGKFMARMEAKDGSAGFDFEGIYTRFVPKKAIEFRMSDGREVKIEFVERQGWQSILDSFGRNVEARSPAG